MATLNELGRNSSSITYGPYTAGQDIWPTFSLVDQWLRADTWNGTATASGTTVTGIGSIWTTQARAGDTIMICGQSRVIASVVSDTSITVTQAFSPAIILPSAVKVINLATYTNATNYANTQAAGYAVSVIRDSTNGTVAVTNGSATVTGTGTYFLSECTNSVTLQSMVGTVSVDQYGTITGTGTTFQSAQGLASGLYPGDSIAITLNGAVYYFEIASIGNDTTATTTFVPPYGAIGSGATIQKATNGVTGRTIQINGRMRVITAIASNVSMTVNLAMDFTDSNLRYKTYPRGVISTAIAGTAIGFTGSIATNVLTVASAQTGAVQVGTVLATAGANFIPGSQVLAQLTATNAATASPTSSGSLSGQNILTVSANTNIVVGMFVSGTGVPADTYVGAINGTAITLVGSSLNGAMPAARNLTGNSTGTYNFYQPGLLGTYTISNTHSSAVASVAFTQSTIQGTGTNFFWDVQQGDQIWVGDEIRTINFSYNYAPVASLNNPSTLVSLTDAVGYTGVAVGVLRQTYTGTNLPTYRRDESYLPGNATNFLADIRVGDDLIIDGTEVTVQLITATNQIKLSTDFTHTTATNGVAATTTLASTAAIGQAVCVVTSATNIVQGQYVTGPGIPVGTFVSAINGTSITLSQNFVGQGNTTGSYVFSNGSVIYKKKKIHGYVLEGTREGYAVSSNVPVAKFSTTTTIVTTAGANTTVAGSNVITVASATGFTPYNIVKIEGAGGTPYPITGQCNTVSASATVTGTNTLFTTQLHIGAEIVIAGQHAYVIAIASDTSMTVSITMSVTGPTPIYRTVPLYTYIASVASTTITLGHTVKTTLYSTGANPTLVYTPSTSADFIEYVYSSTNTSAEATAALSNTSLDRKYVGFRYWPLLQSTFAVPALTTNLTLSTLLGGFAMPVYERWAAAWGQSNGVGINLADTSGGTMIVGSQTTTTLTLTQPVAGQVAVGMNIGGATQVAGTLNQIPFTSTVTGTLGTAGSTYSGLTQSQTTPANSVLIGQLGLASDIVTMTHYQGGFLYLFATNRYMIIQGKSFQNIQTNWLGCCEFERAQPEDAGTGLGTTAGVTYSAFGSPAGIPAGSPSYAMYPINPAEGVIQSLAAVAPWPCYAYFNGNRFPIGAQQVPSLPVAQIYPVHGNVLAAPRVRNSSGDLVGLNAHTYSACTITTGRWGHLFELGGNGSYAPITSATSGVFTTQANATVVPHVGQIVPVYTNVYNSKRFMFSPVVVLGPSYDPDVRGRIYGLKVIPSNLGTLMDTVSITVDNSWFYNTSSAAADHWVITTPPAGGALGTTVTTYRMQANTSSTIQQSYRSLEDTASATVATSALYTNNFRWAIPA